MTDTEFDILDELYFMIDFNTLSLNTKIDVVILENHLTLMIKKEWISIFEDDISVEIMYDNEKFKENFKSYYYLATKKGLFEHNSN